MGHLEKFNNRIKYLPILCVAIVIIALLSPRVRGEAEESLRGEAFSDPHITIDMPADWSRKPIKYEKWAEHADLAVTLDQHLYPALLPIIHQFAREKNVHIAVNEGTCGISAGLIVRKAVDIAGFCCPPAGTDRFPDLSYHTVGIGSLAIFVNPVNPVDSVTFQQAQQIYQGKIARWSELKTADGNRGPDVPVATVARLHCKLRPGHWRLLLDNEDLFTPRLRTVGSIMNVMREVYENDYAFAGMETLYMAHHRYGQDIKLKPLKIDGYDPAVQDHLVSGKYKLYFTYNLAAWSGEGLQKPLATLLIEYLLEHAHQIDARFGIVPSSLLKQAGWIFKDEELTGEPAGRH